MRFKIELTLHCMEMKVSINLCSLPIQATKVCMVESMLKK